MKKLADADRAHIEAQIVQISAFLDHCYDGMCQDLEITWTLRDGYNPVQKRQHKSYGGAADYAARKGRHSKISIGYGDAYYASTSLGHMLHEAAYEWREKLLMQLQEDECPYAADLVREAASHE